VRSGATPLRRVPRLRPWLAVGSLLLLPVVFWAFARSLDTRFDSLPAALSSLANIAGLTGTAAFGFNVVIGSRLPPVARLFDGLDSMYATHRQLGGVAVGLLVGHAFLAAASKAWSSAAAPFELFLPRAGWAVFIGTVALAAMVVALTLTFFARLPHETFVWLQKALGAIFVVAAIHVFGVHATRSFLPLTIYFGVLATAAVAAFGCRAVLGRFLMRRHAFVVERVRSLDESVVEIRLAPRGRPVSFLPGQFLFVSFDDAASGEAHPFSITSSPREPRVEVVVKAVGDYTSALSRLPPGGVARVEGPYGGFSYLNVANPRQIWIAGGIGVTPFLSMARSVDVSAYQIDFYYCTERAEHAHFLEELFEISDRDLSFRVIPIRKTSLGRISAADIQGATRDIDQRDILICGPPVMIRNLRAQFVELGFPSERIHFEDFSFL
jgi:predicted ferric reductase